MEFNVEVKVDFTVGIEKSCCVTSLKEKWLINTSEPCDWVLMDMKENGVIEMIECMGIDLSVQGSFSAVVRAIAREDEAPDYEIIQLTERLWSNVG